MLRLLENIKLPHSRAKDFDVKKFRQLVESMFPLPPDPLSIVFEYCKSMKASRLERTHAGEWYISYTFLEGSMIGYHSFHGNNKNSKETFDIDGKSILHIIRYDTGALDLRTWTHSLRIENGSDLEFTIRKANENCMILDSNRGHAIFAPFADTPTLI